MRLVNQVADESSIVYQQADLTVWVSNQPDPGAVALLEQTVYGSEGIRYRQTGQAQRIHQLNDPQFFSLYEQQQLIGLYCLDCRPVGFRAELVAAYYGRYLAVRADQQGKGFGHLLKATAVNFIQQHTTTPYLFYSYIENKNSRSMAASRSEGFAAKARLNTYLFRRFSPTFDRRVRPLLPSESGLARHLVTTHYAHYGFQHFIHINEHLPYFVLEEAGRPVAGVQASPIQWQLMHIPGRTGPFIRSVAPHVPGLRRFFNPSRQSFLTLEGVFVNRNQPDLLATLLESVLAYYRQHTAMWQIDEQDPLRSLLHDRRMGLLSGFQSGVTTHVMVKSAGLPESILVGQDPVYVSPFDYS